MRQKAKPTLGRYLAKNPLLYVYLTVVDSFCKGLCFFRKTQTCSESPKKILLIHLAHKGDVILATSILSLLKSHYPNATLSMLVGSWSEEILKDHPLLENIHLLDHPKLNRSPISFFYKWKLYLKTLKTLKRELEQYNLSIDLYPYYPNSHLVTWLAKIPRRVGFQSGGSSSLLTDVVSWLYKRQSIALDFLELLKPLGVTSELSTLKPSLSSPCERTFAFLKQKYNLEKPYILFHLYSGNPLKHWKDSSWKELAEKSYPHKIVFTGGSYQERMRIESLTQGLPHTLNLANELSFKQLQALVFHAKALVSIDTMIGHLAAVYDIPSVVLYAGISDPNQWKPLSQKCTVLHKKLECFPCFKRKGCRGMDCLQTISVDDVLKALNSF